jgi:leader peptidase (prepilin peptidase)/N-methyltransferase
LLLALSVVAVGYVVGMAAWQSSSDRLVGFTDLIAPRIADVMIAGWSFFVGSSIGSFLNVVAWRMPRGMRINGRSHCPRCDNILQWYDNLPVIGWLALGGRCRLCRLPISPRYPIVEATVGFCVMWIVVRGVYSDASHLPFWPKRFGYTTSLWIPYLSNDSLAIITYHVAGIACLWALALVRADGSRLPRPLIFWCLLLVAIPMLVVPSFAVVPWTVRENELWSPDGKYLNAVMRVLTGGAMAVMLARMMVKYVCPAADPKLNPLGESTTRFMDLVMLLAVAAIVVGWQAAIPVTVVAILVGAAIPAMFIHSGDPLAKFALGLPIATSLQIAHWRWLHQWSYWPSVNTTAGVTLAWAAAILLLPRLLVTAPRSKAIAPDPDSAVSD